MGSIDNLTWLAFGLLLTVVGLGLSLVAYRRRGAAAGLRGAAWSLLPLAAGLTHTLRLAAEITEDVGSWAARLVFSPSVWLGVVVLSLSGVLFVVSGVLRARGEPAAAPRRRARSTGAAAPDAALPRSSARPSAAAPSEDGDMAEIEAILRKHGIS